jgi:hypothetical protein
MASPEIHQVRIGGGVYPDHIKEKDYLTEKVGAHV